MAEGHDKYLETLNFVVNFLHEEGFHKAHNVLLQEFSTRLQGSASPSAEGAVFATSRQSISACSAPPSTSEYGERALEALSPPRSKSAQAGPSWEGFPGPLAQPKAASTAGAVESAPVQGPPLTVPKQAAASPTSAPPSRAGKARVYRAAHQRHRPVWDGEVDDYENMEDPGYSRRDVPSQARFAETELDACSEDGSERAYFMHQPGDLNYDDIESEVSASDPEGITAASSVQSGQYGAFSGDAHDETWDLGPTDIKFAEPVSTPSKSPEKQEPEERRPVLSRVESLSSSFKDFEMERGFNADGEGEGQISSKVSESEHVADPAEVIDFPVSVVNHEDVELFRHNRQSPTSSMDVARGSLAPSVAPSEGQAPESASGKERGRRKGSAKNMLLKTFAAGRNSNGRENGPATGGGSANAGALGGGGFSFPVTPPSDEPEQRLFTSWPSVRSSCTSEPVATSDDDNALPAEYADDEYSKYRLSSRSTSLAAQDFPADRKTTDGDASGAPPSPDGASTSGNIGGSFVDTADAGLEWEFKPPVDRLAKREREPSLEFSTPNTDDESAGTPKALSLAASGAQPDLSSSASPGQPGPSPEVAEDPSEGSAASGRHSRTGEVAAATLDVPAFAVVPPVPAEAGAATASSQQPSQQGPQAETMDRKDSSQVVAHSINFDVEELGAESHDGGDAEPCPQSPAAEGAAACPGRPDQTQPPLQQQKDEEEDSGEPAIRRSDLAVASFSEPTSYDGNEADVDEPLDGQVDGLDDSINAMFNDDDDATGPTSAGGRSSAPPRGYGLDEAGERITATLYDQGDAADEEEEMGVGSLVGTAAEIPDEWGEEDRLQAPEEAKDSACNRPESSVMPRYHMDEQGNVLYEYEAGYIDKKYEVFELRIIHRRHRTGFEETKDFPIRLNDLIAGRYQVMDFLGSAAFSRAVQALDVKTGQLVCLKIIKNNKDYFDQSLDEIKLLKYVNSMDPNDEYAIVRLYDFFYYKEHLFLVCELLRANLYEFQKYNKESGDELYFTNARIQRIARQALRSLAFLHSLGLIHSDLKPENILIKSYSRCEVKVIDLGSSCFITDQLSSYVQSRSYRAPEVILGLPYDYKVDVWSLGCILAELSSGYVLFQNDSLATLLARLEGILGPIPEWMLHKGRYAHRFYTRSGMLYERPSTTQRYELLLPKRTSLRHRMPDADEGLLEFVSYLLTVDPRKRPTAAEALKHPWLQQEYPSLDG
ncbi:hypothetical protein PLESTB_000694600 [Pleodorina starrii]|uniref:Protein kinase domain-containing protein n=1 Tax=Pleodorina starrii TaxID=330485 RepID=A0A9W6BJM8_9CHLO|nr:hypothetical protein PLESTB_000694600 [Pleodorina starrii]